MQLLSGFGVYQADKIVLVGRLIGMPSMPTNPERDCITGDEGAAAENARPGLGPGSAKR